MSQPINADFAKFGRRVFAVLLVLVLAPSLTKAFEFSLQFHSGLQHGTTIAEVVDSAGIRIAFVTWAGQLPSGFGDNQKALFVPVVVLGGLRDQVVGSQTAAGSEAYDWIQRQMGELADTPLSLISANVFAEIKIEYFWEWCGQTPRVDGSCPDNCTSSSTWTCAGCGCRGTKPVLESTTR